MLRLALFCLVAAIAVGCSSDSAGPDPAGPDPAGPDPGGTSRESVPAQGLVVLPDGDPTDLATLRVQNSFGTYGIEADGSFEARVEGDGANLILLTDEEGNLRLVGYIDPSQPTPGEISAHETAVALLFLATGSFAGASAELEQVLGWIREDAATSALASALESQLAANRTALMTADATILAAIETAITDMTSAAQKALIRSEPSGTPDGVIVGGSPQQGETGLQVTNLKRRNLYYFVYKTGYETEAGEMVELDPPVAFADGFLGAPDGLDGTVGTLVGWLFGDLGFQPVSLPEAVSLPVETEEAEAYFEVVVSGSHVPDLSGAAPAWWSSSSNPDRDLWQTRASQLTALSLMKDIVLPAVFNVVSPVRSLRRGDIITYAQASTFITAIGEDYPDVILKMNAGDWYGAAQEILEAYADSAAVRTSLSELFFIILQEELGDSFDSAVSTLATANVFVRALDIGLGSLDVGIVVADNSGAPAMDHWDITAIPQGITMDAEYDILTPDRFAPEVTATVRGAPEGTRFCYRWTIQGDVGRLVDAFGAETMGAGTSFVTTENSVQYIVNPGGIPEGDLDPIEVEAFEETDPETCNLNALVARGEITLEGQPNDPCPEFDRGFWLEGLPNEQVWTITVLTPVIRGGDDVIVEARNNTDTPSQLNLLIPTVFYNGSFSHPRTEDIEVTGGGDNVSFFVVDDGLMWHWFRGDVVSYPLVSWGVQLRVQSVAPGTTVTINVPTGPEFSELAAMRECFFSGPFGPGETFAQASYGFISELNGNFLEQIQVLE